MYPVALLSIIKLHLTAVLTQILGRQSNSGFMYPLMDELPAAYSMYLSRVCLSRHSRWPCMVALCEEADMLTCSAYCVDCILFGSLSSHLAANGAYCVNNTTSAATVPACGDLQRSFLPLD